MSLPPPKTVVAALSVLAVLVLIQLVVVFTIFIRRASLLGSGPVAPAPSALAANIPPVTPAKNPARSAVAARPATSPQEIASPAAEPSAPVASSEREAMVERSRATREKGDMTGALAGLREAQNKYPDDPLIVSEMAITYEQMGLVDKALNQWKRVVDAGEKAGDLYGIAAEKLKHGVSQLPDAGARDEEGLQPGSILGFADLQKTYNDKSGLEEVGLQVAIKSRSTSAISAGDVNTQMAFYDLVGNTEVEQTNAKVTWNWVTAPPDWQDDGLEILKINYARNTADSGGARTAGDTSGDRRYLGYIIRVYYKNELQDVRAEPVKLLQYFPPQVTLQSEIPQ